MRAVCRKLRFARCPTVFASHAGAFHHHPQARHDRATQTQPCQQCALTPLKPVERLERPSWQQRSATPGLHASAHAAFVPLCSKGIRRIQRPASHHHVLSWPTQLGGEEPSLDSVQQYNRGQKDPVCFLKQKRKSIWADLQLPSLRWDQVSNICILLMTVLQLMASSECTRFTVSLSPDTEICSLGHFLIPLALLTAAGMRQTAACSWAKS